MKKDIIIPKVTDVELAVVLDKNKIDDSDEWGVYIINKKDIDLEMVVIVSQGFSETKTTSIFRKKINLLPANSYFKFELIQPELFALDNRFQVTFFENNTLYDKTFIFKNNVIKKDALTIIPILQKSGVVVR